MKFKLVTRRDEVGFEVECERLVDKGYRPQGGVSVSWNGLNQPLYAMMFVMGDFPESHST